MRLRGGNWRGEKTSAGPPGRAPQILEDHFQIVRVERGRVRLAPMVSDEPVTTTLPQPVATACRPGWTHAGMLGRVRGHWRLAEVTFPRMTDAGGA